jgi:hypothetical protein
MDRILALLRRHWSISIMIVVAALMLPASRVLAANYNAWMTGYAFGNLYGASGAVVAQTDFANHSSTYCPSDPAASWPWGTYIYLVSNPSVIYLSNAKGQYWPVTAFDLWDKGDPQCQMGNYWVDIYFGRYTWTPSNCNCQNSPPNGCCVYGTTNNCQDAINFSSNWATYRK